MEKGSYKIIYKEYIHFHTQNTVYIRRLLPIPQSYTCVPRVWYIALMIQRIRTENLHKSTSYEIVFHWQFLLVKVDFLCIRTTDPSPQSPSRQIILHSFSPIRYKNSFQWAFFHVMYFASGWSEANVLWCLAESIEKRLHFNFKTEQKKKKIREKKVVR